MTGRQIDPIAAERAERKVLAAQQRHKLATQKVEESRAKFWQSVMDGYESGITYVRMAALLGVSEVTVHNILKQQRLIRGGQRGGQLSA